MTTTREDIGVPVAKLEQFSQQIAQSPRWAVVRRFAPVPLTSQLADTTGAVQGTLVGVEVGPLVDLSAEEALGIDDPTGNDSGFVRQDAYLMVEVASAIGSGAAGLDGDIVAVPVPIWLSGGQELGGDDFAAEVLELVTDAAPLGVPTLVLIEGADTTTTDQAVLDVAGEDDASSLSGVVFEAADGTLFGLDWLIGTHAEEHYGASTLERLAAKTAS